MKKLFLILLAVSLLWVSSAGAATIKAVSCSQADVQAAINSAASGDVVIIPAGSCTWTSAYSWKAAVSIPNTKKIMVQGMGIDSTVITQSPKGIALNAGQAGSRITGIKFVDGQVNIDGDGWRIDHCVFYSTAAMVGIYAQGNRVGQHPKGVIDHNTFYNCRVLVTGRYTYMCNDQWVMPLSLGTENAVYVEDNTFNDTTTGGQHNAMDANMGARYVFRCNTVNDRHVEVHSIQGTMRGVRSWEIYNNTFNQVNKSMWTAFRIRSGTGVVFNNILNGKWNGPSIFLDNRRSCENLGKGGLCNGSSLWDGNQLGQNGYPCRDQIGRSTDAWLWTDANPYPPQELDPAYAWNNKYGSKSVDFALYPGCANTAVHIKEGRDYFNNMVKPGYKPYTYPHPLIKEWDDKATFTCPKCGFRW